MRSPRLAGRGQDQDQEAHDPNRAGGSEVKKRGPLGGLEGSRRKQQRKKPSKKDRRRVSFAPDPELTLVHHFVKDDDYMSHSDGGGRFMVTYADEEPSVGVAPPAQQQQHPALAGCETGGGGSYFPGFWAKAVPENSPLSDVRAPPESPDAVSMELTMPAAPAHQQQQQQHVPGEVTAGLPSLGALAEADEWEEADGGAAAQHAAPGEVTAALPSLGALADADELEAAAADAAAANLTHNITAALPGLGDLVEEDEGGASAAEGADGDTVGMDLTVAAGRVLEHHLQQQQQHAEEAAQRSPAPTAVVDVASSPAAAAHEVEQPAADVQAAAQHPALAQPETASASAELEPTQQVGSPATRGRSLGRMSLGRVSLGGTDEVAGEATKAAQLNKWGFAPGQEDTLDINLEMHGKLIMGDQTFSRMYCDNTTDDGGYCDRTDNTGSSPALLVAGGDATGEAAAAAPSPAPSQAAPPAPSPAPSAGRAYPPAAPVPNWTAPAFVPPYAQAPAGSSAPSDHPALVHSPDVTGSSFNTLETRRVSVGVDMRRASISSRRFSMQDATGRLLADDGLLSGGDAPALPAAAATPAGEALPPADARALASSGPRSRRRSSGAAFLVRGDVTEALLADEEDSLGGDEGGALADLKRQMRLLSQSSPVAALVQPEAVAAVAAAAEEEAAELAAAELQAEQAVHPTAAPAAAKTPRAAVSMGYADSHNPATAALLRSNGTTRLLADSLGVADDDDEEDLLADDGEEGGGATGGPSPAGMRLGDAGGVTARTNGTTKLLADMTMASVVGAKLLGRPGVAGTPELAHGAGNDGLTDYSLDEFEAPPELPDGAAAGEDEDMLAEAPSVEEQEQYGLAQQQQYVQPAEDYASPALAPAGREFGAGYPLDGLAAGDGPIPGGPKLARTPVTARPASAARPQHGTPHSQPRTLRSQQLHQHSHATPTTHGTHRLARTPGSVRPPAAAYPTEADLTADNVIPGGPKLARTPMGRTPATGGYTGGYAAAPGSAVAQHYPGSARGVRFAPGPGSASAQRYPGSAVAAHRAGGLTPRQFAPQPMTFQDFARLTEVQFLDNLRRGASINYADLQPNPVPASLAEAYRLLTVISLQVTTLESGIRILQEEVQARRISVADAEQLVGQVNPVAFQKAAAADDEVLEDLKDHVGQLKKVCRLKAVYCLKDVRRQMEESRGGRLLRNLEALQGDLALAESSKEQLEGVAQAAEQFISEQHRRMAQEDQAHQEEAERRTALVKMRHAVAEEVAANEQRRQQLAEVQERAAKLREEHSVLQREREALRARTDALQMTLLQSQGRAGGLGNDSEPAAILQKLEELDTLKRCVGWELESAAEDPVSGEVALRVGGLFRLCLSISRAGASTTLEMLPEEGCRVPADCRALLAALAGCAGGATLEVHVGECSGPTVAAVVQATTARISRLAELAGELDGLRLAFPALSEVSCSADGTVELSLLNLDAEAKLSVQLHLPASYPLGPVQHKARLWFGDEAQLGGQRIAAAVAAAPEAPGRLKAICSQLSQLMREALPAPALPTLPALEQDAAFSKNWENPLFGCTPALSART